MKIVKILWKWLFHNKFVENLPHQFLWESWTTRFGNRQNSFKIVKILWKSWINNKFVESHQHQILWESPTTNSLKIVKVLWKSLKKFVENHQYQIFWEYRVLQKSLQFVQKRFRNVSVISETFLKRFGMFLKGNYHFTETFQKRFWKLFVVTLDKNH
jgi:hypothetical protein